MLTGSLFWIRPQTPLWLLVLLKTCQSKTTGISKTTGFSIRNCILFFEKHIQLDEHEWQEIDLGLHSSSFLPWLTKSVISCFKIQIRHTSFLWSSLLNTVLLWVLWTILYLSFRQFEYENWFWVWKIFLINFVCKKIARWHSLL